MLQQADKAFAGLQTVSGGLGEQRVGQRTAKNREGIHRPGAIRQQGRRQFAPVQDLFFLPERPQAFPRQGDEQDERIRAGEQG